jgi:hypothetical protein
MSDRNANPYQVWQPDTINLAAMATRLAQVCLQDFPSQPRLTRYPDTLIAQLATCLNVITKKRMSAPHLTLRFAPEKSLPTTTVLVTILEPRRYPLYLPVCSRDRLDLRRSMDKGNLSRTQCTQLMTHSFRVVLLSLLNNRCHMDIPTIA